MITFRIKIANIVLEVNAFNETTKKYCDGFLTNEEPQHIITLTQEDLENEKHIQEDGKVYASEEISALYRKIADLFVEHHIVVFHGSCFMVNNFAFIVTARSGVGKSTHVGLLKKLLGNKFSYINDDKPLLEVTNDELMIHSSPWNGKERRGNDLKAPLKAVIFLNRGNNTYKQLTNNQEVYFRLLSQIYLPKDKSKREKALKIIDVLLKRVNFYEINVNKELDAASLTYERIIKNEIK